MSKRFINSPDKVAKETIRAFALDANQVALHPTHNVLVRSSIALPNNPPRVAVVSGGGSGHEPMPAGFVGQGMLAAAVAGDLFASPSPPAITSMLEAVASSATAILLVVMNYQGDRLNFTMALHTFKQKFPTFPVKMLLVGDDVAIHNSTECRGLAGACFVLKIAGSAADAGCSFEQVVDIAENAISSLVSFGVALEPCTIPGSATDTNRLKENEGKYVIQQQFPKAAPYFSHANAHS